MLDYHSPYISFPRSTIAEARLVAFSPFLRNTSVIIKGLCRLGRGEKKKENGSKLDVYLIVGQELAPMEMLAEGNAVKCSPFYESAKKPRGRWQFLNNSQLHFLGKYLLMCPDNNVLWKCVCTMSLTKARLLTWTQSGTALEQCLTYELLSSSNNKTSCIQHWTKQSPQITFIRGKKKSLLKRIYF